MHLDNNCKGQTELCASSVVIDIIVRTIRFDEAQTKLHHVNHDYHDHLQSENRCRYTSSNGSQVRAYGKNKAFPLKLHERLDNAEVLGINCIISWQIHGRAFCST